MPLSRPLLKMYMWVKLWSKLQLIQKHTNLENQLPFKQLLALKEVDQDHLFHCYLHPSPGMKQRLKKATLIIGMLSQMV